MAAGRSARLPRIAGHRAGVAALRRVVERAPDIGIGCLTVYAFSSDNWRRPASEVESIFWLLRAFLRLETNGSDSAARAPGHRPTRSADQRFSARSTRQNA